MVGIFQYHYWGMCPTASWGKSSTARFVPFSYLIVRITHDWCFRALLEGKDSRGWLWHKHKRGGVTWQWIMAGLLFLREPESISCLAYCTHGVFSGPIWAVTPMPGVLDSKEKWTPCGIHFFSIFCFHMSVWQGADQPIRAFSLVRLLFTWTLSMLRS